jgi:hypothetical protein
MANVFLTMLGPIIVVLTFTGRLRCARALLRARNTTGAAVLIRQKAEL